MKYPFILLLFTLSIPELFAQKPIIDPSMYDKIPYSVGQRLSNDGKYIAYDVSGGFFPRTSPKLVIQSMLANWKLEITNGGKSAGQITTDSKYWLFLTKKDSLGILDLRSKGLKYIDNVSDFIIPQNGSGEWLVYVLNDNEKTIILHSLKTGKEKTFSNISMYKLDDGGKDLVLLNRSQNEGEKHSIKWVNLVNGSNVLSWSSENIDNLILDFKHQQLAFKMNSSIYYYKKGMKGPILLMAPKARDNFAELNLGDLGSFSYDGKRLHLTLVNNEHSLPLNKSVEVWSYKDYPLQSVQEGNIKSNRNSCQAVILLDSHKLIQLENLSNECIFEGLNDDFALSVKVDSRFPGWCRYTDNVIWNSPESKRVFNLINTKTGEKKELSWLTDLNNSGENAKISPGGKYLVCYLPKYNGYVSYDIALGTIVKLTSSLDVNFTRIENIDYAYPQYFPYPRGIAGWLQDDKAVLIYDQHDVWKIDPQGKIPPLNLTNGYGLKNNVVFKLALNAEKGLITMQNNELFISAFNLKNKDNGFYKIKIDKRGDPERCTMGPYIYKAVTNYMPWIMDPIKAKYENLYLVQRMSSKEPANYFSTQDFRTFTRITDFKPDMEYNWYTTELHNWKSLDGRELQGVLYKPENFDPVKKYPVIFFYYERKSDRLNAYLKPEYSEGEIDIATYVSSGYLVFTPDIYYTPGDPMQGAYDAVVSAARYVSTFPFVNSKKMGIQGHSFGAIQTNYLVTHTDLFAAACSSSGLSDFISGYGSLGGNIVEGYGSSLAGIYELGQTRMGSSLWENPSSYLRNSSIFNIDKVTTPILIEHGKLDGICPYTNIMEFFLGLRRLGKKAWMLVYPEGDHNLNGKDAEDFTLRMRQFFDHYLKDKPAPMWMLDGIRASRREIDTGLQLDSAGRTPGPGLLTPEEQRKVDSLMTRKPITITLR